MGNPKQTKAVGDAGGSATVNATVTVDNETAYRRGGYFWRERPITNDTDAVWEEINVASKTCQSSLLTLSLFCLPCQAVGHMGPTAHLQSSSYPLQCHDRLPPQTRCNLYLLCIAFAS